MSDLVGNPEDRFSQNEAQLKPKQIKITSVGEERAAFFCYRLLVFLLFLFEGVPLPLGAFERLRYFILAPLGFPYNYLEDLLPRLGKRER